MEPPDVEIGGPSPESFPDVVLRPRLRVVVGWLIPIALSGGLVTAGKGWPTHFPALLGPLLAAIVVIARQQGRAGVVGLMRRMVRVRMPLRWWFFAVSPLLVLALVLTIEVTSGLALTAYSGFAIFSGLPSRWGVVAVAATIFLVNGFGEETGWRGFALPTLQSRLRPLSSAVSTALVIGLAVSLVGLEVRAMRRGGVSVLGPTCHDL